MNKALADFADRGWIKLEGNSLLVLNFEGLRAERANSPSITVHSAKPPKLCVNSDHSLQSSKRRRRESDVGPKSA